MASNLDYLDPALIPLEEKVKAYLETEKALRRATGALKNTSPPDRQQNQSAARAEQLSAPGGYDQQQQEPTPALDNLRHDLARLEQEILTLLPTRDEWVKVNLGYGPSRVGAWLVPATGSAPARHELRVVH